MSYEIILQLTNEDGFVVQKSARLAHSGIYIDGQRLVAISDNVAELTRLRTLSLTDNAFVEIPAGVFALTQLMVLNLAGNRLAAIPPEIGRLTRLTTLFVGGNALVAVPREVGRLTALERLELYRNALTAVPAELGRLRALRSLFLYDNRLTWLPRALERLPPTAELLLGRNPLPVAVPDVALACDLLPEIFRATTALSMIREEATAMAIGLHGAELPALVTLEIFDAAWQNSIPMHKKWDLVVAVKHFHQRRAQRLLVD